MKKTIIHIVNLVWGEEYVRIFLDFSLNFQLTEGNLAFFKKTEKYLPKYKIYTTKEDLIYFENSENFNKLKSLVDVEFIIIEKSSFDKKYLRLNKCHYDAIEKANKENGVLMFLHPDVIISENTFKECLRIYETGMRSVSVAIVRLKKENFIKDVKASKIKTFFPRDLIKLALPNLHKSSASLFWNRKKVREYCSDLYWNLGSEGILIRGFHLHVLLLSPENKNENLNPNYSEHIANEYFSRAVPSADKRYVVEDSDQFTMVDLITNMTDRHNPNEVLRKKTISYIANWARRHGNTHSWQTLQKKIFLKTCNYRPDWKSIEAQSDKIIYSIMKRASRNKIDSFLRFILGPWDYKKFTIQQNNSKFLSLYNYVKRKKDALKNLITN